MRTRQELEERRTNVMFELEEALVWQREAYRQVSVDSTYAMAYAGASARVEILVARRGELDWALGGGAL